mmetsp:Transcript_155068/g.376545  ORF Transcript_155068/g.376545 Transcript_155068/m.376545 type:complete len:134 (-) Transcript_155068:187-588(-)
MRTTVAIATALGVICALSIGTGPTTVHAYVGNANCTRMSENCDDGCFQQYNYRYGAPAVTACQDGCHFRCTQPYPHVDSCSKENRADQACRRKYRGQVIYSKGDSGHLYPKDVTNICTYAALCMCSSNEGCGR